MRSTLIVSMLAGLAAAGCSSTAPQWESRFGDSARQLRAQQTLDAGAPLRNGDRAPSADGVSAVRVIDNYRQGKANGDAAALSVGTK